jgi:O-antigen ligase
MQEGGKELREVITRTLGICLVIAIFPWFFGGQEPVAMFVTAGAMLLAVGLIVMQPAVRKMPFGFLGRTYVALMLFALLSLAWSVNRYSSMSWLIEWVTAGMAFWVAYILAGEPSGRKLMVNLYMVVTGIFSMAAVWIFMTTEYNRLTGWFYWPNPAAAFLIPAILISIDWMRRNKHKKEWWWLAVAVGFLTTFLLTDSRAAGAVLGVVGAVYLIIVPETRKFWIKLLFIGVLSLGLTIGLGELAVWTGNHSGKIVPGSRFAAVANGNSESLSDRINYLESAVKIWLANPIIGRGAGTYQNVHPIYQKRVVSASTSAHNEYVQILAELGLIGFILMVLLLLALGGGTLRGLVQTPQMMPVVLGALGIFLHMGLDIDATYPSLLILAAVLLGLVWSAGETSKTRATVVWPIVAIAVLMPTVSLYESNVWANRGAAAQNNNDFETAAADYSRAASGLTYNPAYLNAEGIDLYAIGTIGGSDGKSAASKALAVAKQGIHQDPDGSQQYQLEGRVLELQGNFKAAIGAFRQALSYDPYNHPDYALDLATAQLIIGQQKTAIQTANQMLAQYPLKVAANRSLDPTVNPNLADLEALVGNYDLDNGNLPGARQAAKIGKIYDPKSIRVDGLTHKLATLGD